MNGRAQSLANQRSLSGRKVGRRSFLKQVGCTLTAAALPPVVIQGKENLVFAQAETSTKTSENYVQLLFESLTESQRKFMHFPFEHPLRRRVENNWNIVDPKVGAIGQLYTLEQQEIIRKILKGILTEDGHERIQKQMKDDSGGIENYTCAVFGDPTAGKFEWVMTGRHLTLRADGDSVQNAALGGPIFYGHAVEGAEKPDHPGNVWWHQARLANKVYESLDGKQRELALLPESPEDDSFTVFFEGVDVPLPGIPGHELSGDQKEHLEGALKGLLGMFRQSDVDEVMECLRKNGGIDSLHMSFYKDGDLGQDKIWDRWRIEGPAFIWYFRGSPHVHTWLNVAHSADGNA